MTDLLNDRIQAAMNILADNFVFRKLGLCYDLRSASDDFPGKTLPTAKEISQQKPDARGTFTGMAEIGANVFDRINAEWNDFGAIPDYLIADEQTGRVAAVCTYVGTYKATGKAQHVRVVHLWTVKDGQIVAFEQFCDTAEQLKSMN